MKICYIPTFTLPWCATSWRRALELGKAVAKYHKITFMCPCEAIPSLKEKIKNIDINLLPVKFKGQGYLAKGFARAMAVKQFDIVHTFKPTPDIFPAGFAAKFKKCKWIADLDDLEGSQGFNRNSSLWKRKTMDFFEWMVPYYADAVTVASKGLEEYYKKFNPFYIPNGADPEVFKPVEHSNDKIKILFMGRFHPEIIDADVVIRAVSKVSQKHNVKLLMIGGGYGRKNVEKLAQKLNLDTQFTGHIDNVPKVIAKADIGVISFRDNMLNKCKCPLRLYEYMACGLPIVSTKIGEPAHVLSNGTGLLIQPNEDSIAGGILNLIESTNLRKKMSEKGRDLILKKYNWESLGKKLVEFYQKDVFQK